MFTGKLKLRRSTVPARPVRPIAVHLKPPVPVSEPQAKSGCACGGQCPACLTAGPDHPAEREADSVAAQVMQMDKTEADQRSGPARDVPGEPAPQLMQGDETPGEVLQLQPEEEEEEPLQMQAEDEEELQMQTEEEEEELLQPKADTGRAPVAAKPMQGLSSGRPLPAGLRSFFEPRFGRDFSAVRIHDDTAAASRAADLNARAFAYGNHIVFAAGRFAPDTRAGRTLIAHELTHTVQQGRAKPLVQRAPEPDMDATTEGSSSKRSGASSLARSARQIPISPWTRQNLTG